MVLIGITSICSHSIIQCNNRSDTTYNVRNYIVNFNLIALFLLFL